MVLNFAQLIVAILGSHVARMNPELKGLDPQRRAHPRYPHEMGDAPEQILSKVSGHSCACRI